MYKSLFICSLSLLAFTACEKKPKACLALDDVLEAGTTLYLESCSEHYDFLTWEFNDERGYVSDVVERRFEDEASYSLKLTAYSDGGYRSDTYIHHFKTSYRFVDRFEITGNSNFTGIEVRFKKMYEDKDGGVWSAGGATGEFTDDAPFTIYSWPAMAIRLPDEQETIQFFGLQGTSRTLLGELTVSFQQYKANPVVIESEVGNLRLKMYWTFRY